MMNRAILMLSLAVLSGGAGEAQGESSVSVGVFGGTNLASLDIEGAPKEARERRTALAVGVLLAVRPAEAISIELRPSYVGRGARVLVAGVQADVEADYIELPLVLTGELGHGRVRPYALASAALGFRTSAKTVTPAGKQDIADDFAGTDTSLRLGGGLRLRSASAEPFVEGEYAWGLKNLNTRATGLGAGLGAIRNRGLQIRAGVSFRLGKK
jgi:Outer membrane protein beta-barrel domain